MGNAKKFPLKQFSVFTICRFFFGRGVCGMEIYHRDGDKILAIKSGVRFNNVEEIEGE